MKILLNNPELHRLIAGFTLMLALIIYADTLYAQAIFKTNTFLMEIGTDGSVTKMLNPATGTDYVPESRPGQLIRIKSAGLEMPPQTIRFHDNIIQLMFEGGPELEILVTQNKDYIKFELIKVLHADKIDAILWGPFHTTISETIGEVVGVVRNLEYAIGMRALNAKTIGGQLLNEEGVTGGAAAITGNTASPEEFGSSVQAFSINQALDRVITVWHNHHNCPVAGLPDYTLEGGAIAIFGTTPDRALQTIGIINQSEGLPYQVIDGAWTRTSKITGKPYLIASFSEENFDEMLDFTERLGFYSIYHSHPFETWGHFDLRKILFPNGREGMKACVEKANAKNIRVGVHTLTNFITTNDPFVTTEANSGLMAAGISFLNENIDATSTEIAVDNYEYFAQASTLNSVLIGNEIIRYQEVSKDQPYKLINCIRGAFETKATAHKKGDPAKKLMDYPYKTLFPDWEMQNQLIQNMADFFNETGVSHMDFDGHEGTCYTGRGDYAANYFAGEFLKKVNHLVVNGSSNMNHYYWNANSYINWGEPWYANFRESQSEHRFSLQPFFERNYMPNMLGWFLMTPDTFVEDIEWMLARAAGYNAGYAFVADYQSFKLNPNTDMIINAIRTWEEAKELGIFSEAQRIQLKDLEKDFHLEKTGMNQWILQGYEKFNFEHRRTILQPGQPSHTEFTFNNAHQSQPIHLQLLITGDASAKVSDIVLEVDNFFTVKIPGTFNKGETLVWDGTPVMKLYDDKGKLMRTVAIDKSLAELTTGTHKISIDAGAMEGTAPIIKATIRLRGSVDLIQLN